MGMMGFNSGRLWDLYLWLCLFLYFLLCLPGDNYLPQYLFETFKNWVCAFKIERPKDVLQHVCACKLEQFY